MPAKVQQIVQIVDRRTESRAKNKIDLRSEFFSALDEFCLEQHFWWRKKRALWPLNVGDTTIDLSQNSPDFAGIDHVCLLDSSGLKVQSDLSPILDPAAQFAATVNTTPQTPSAFFIDTGVGPYTLRLSAPSNVAQTLMWNYWAVPSNFDVSLDDIPLVPGYLHWGLGYGLERRVYEFLYGQDDPRWTMAEKRYQDFVVKAGRVPDWTTEKVVESRALGLRAVRSHR